jgi:NosR/NirI family transcriptional regulator, nitrous oxide reductase regulator
MARNAADEDRSARPERRTFFRNSPVSRPSSFGDKLYRLKSCPKKFNSSVSFKIMPILKNYHKMLGLTVSSKGGISRSQATPFLTNSHNPKYHMRRLIPLVMVLILVSAIVHFRVSTHETELLMMKELIPEATRFEKISGSICKAFVLNTLAGYIAIQSAVGYGGPIVVLAIYDTEGKLKDVRISNHSETPSFFQYVLNKGFLGFFLGKHASEPFKLGHDINAISSATYTSRGIAAAVRKGAHELAERELKLPVTDNSGRSLTPEEYLFLALVVLTYIFNRRGWTWARLYILVASFVLLGLWLKWVLNMGNIATLISGRIPPWNEMPFWVIPALGIITLNILTGRNLFCHWLCPFGCVMQMTGKLGQFAGVNWNHSTQNRHWLIVNLRLLLAWFALTLGFFMGNPGASTFEPFGTLFSFRGNTSEWVLMVFTLSTGLVIYRFWCRFLCPTGALCDLVSSTRRKIKKMRWISAIKRHFDSSKSKQ